MKPLTKKLLLISGALLLALPESATALAAFSRQTGENCMACHAQNMPKLNSHGREFALSGYAAYDKNSTNKSIIEGSDVPLGLASTLNVSAVLKASYVKRDEVLDPDGVIVGEERNKIQYLEGSGLFLGGRVADNFGGLVSLQGDASEEKDVVYGGKLITAYPTMGGYAGMSLISTKINGIFSGMENYNTGLNAALKQFENSYATNAAQATGVGNGPATGLQAYYGGSNLFVTVGITIPSQNGEGIDAGRSLIPFYRVAYNLPVSDWNFMMGVYGFNGDAEASDESLNGGLITGRAELVNIHKEGYGFDFELNGDMFGMSTMTTVNYVLKNVVDVNPALLTSYNLQRTDNRAGSVEFQINPIEEFGLKVSYLKYANNDSTATAQRFIKNYSYQSYTAGAIYSLRDNISFGIEYTRSNPEMVNVDDYNDFYLTAAIVF
jgi:hypothetical protein